MLKLTNVDYSVFENSGNKKDILKVDYNIWFDKIVNKEVNYETK